MISQLRALTILKFALIEHKKNISDIRRGLKFDVG